MTSQTEAGAVPRVITADWLLNRLDWRRDRKECAEKQIDRFRRTFGESADLTRANLSRAAAVPLDLEWFARVVLPQRDWQDFQRATEATRLEIERAMEPARQDWERAEEQARQEFERVRADVLADLLGLE